MAFGWVRVMATSDQLQRAPMDTIRIIPTRARLTATMGRNGSWAACSLAPVHGFTDTTVTVITVAASVTTDLDTATTGGVITDQAPMRTTAAVVLVTLAATHMVRLAVASTAVDDGKQIACCDAGWQHVPALFVCRMARCYPSANNPTARL